MGRVAQGRLSFERAGAATACSEAYAESPLRLFTLRSRGPSALAFTSTLGGGLLDGDRVRLDVSLGPGAQACVATQGPTRVFRAASGCKTELCAKVAGDAMLALLPDPVACFAGARLEQRTSVELESSASLLLWEVLSAGRDGWSASRCRSALTVRREGRALLDEAVLLDPAHGRLEERLGRFRALATLILSGPRFSSSIAGPLRARIDAAPAARGARLLQSASPLGPDGVLLRLAGASVEEVQAALRAHLAPLPSLFGHDPWRRDASHAA